MSTLRKWRPLIDLVQLFFPKLCAVCGNHLLRNEEVLCSKCEYHIPRTYFYKKKANAVEQVFWGRIPVENACSFFYFEKGGKYQSLIHQLKYRGRKDIGIYMGWLFGFDLLKSDSYAEVDFIIPVPLHPKKERQRGYNQSLMIAKGLSESLGKPLEDKVLIRTLHSSSQTKKSRYERWENVQHIFDLQNFSTLEHMHVLLVDDVLTTGATLEACIQALLRVKNIRVLMATFAFA